MHKKQRTQTKPWLKKRGPRWSLIGLMAVGLLLVVGLGTFAVATIGGKGDLNAVLRKRRDGLTVCRRRGQHLLPAIHRIARRNRAFHSGFSAAESTCAAVAWAGANVLARFAT
jgi:hypothetical protein